jgi:UMP-CMP kinase
MDVTIKLLETAMRAELEKTTGLAQGRFLIDGFPRKMDQALKFDEDVGFISLLLNLAAVCLSRSAYRLSLFSLPRQRKSCSAVSWSEERPADVRTTMSRVSRSAFVCNNSVFHPELLNIFVGTYKNDTMPVIIHYTKLNKVAEVRNVFYPYVTPIDDRLD